MWRRISMAGAALLATLIVYQAYDFALVPILEPQVVRRAYIDQGEEPVWDDNRGSLNRYKALLANYFPAGHWSLVGTPKIIENGQMMLVLEDYEPDERGGVLLKNCAVIGFPTPRQSSAPPPMDAIVIEAPGGAKLQFDEAFNPTRGKIGRLLSGYFPGELVIRSKMTKPGTEDDLYIRTSELRLKESLIYTNEMVEFRFGLHQASGRQLEIRLLKEEHLKPGETGLEIAGIASLEVRQDVQAQLALPTEMTSFGGSLNDSTQDNVAIRSIHGRAGQVNLTTARSHSLTSSSTRLLTIQSEGPFRFDFMRFMASFQQNVQATLPRDEGPSDQLLCTELRLHFSDREGEQAILSPADEPELAKRQGDLLGALKPFMLEAMGNPIRLDSPASQSALRGQKLQAWLGERRVRIEGAPATLANGLNEAQAAWIDYRSPPENAASPLGDLMMAGPGWLRVTPKKDQPERAIEARWKANAEGGPAVVMQRDHTGQPVLEVVGRPEIASSLLGRMISDSLRIRLREVPADGPEGPAIELGSSNNGDDIAVLAERIDAIGTVEFRGKELTGRTNSLVAWLRPLEARTLEARQKSRGSSLTKRNQNPNTGSAKRNYVLSAKQVQLDVGLFGRRAEPTGLLCTGQVRFEEAAPTGGAATPLRVIGEQLRVDGLHEEGIRLTVAGQADGQVRATAAGGSERPGLAQITGKGIRLWAKELHADQLRNRLWIDGPGDARFDLNSRQMNSVMPGGMASAQGETKIRWTGGLEFDGKQIELRDEVLAEMGEDWLRCNRLVARLSQPIDLSGDNKALGGEVEIAEVECFDGVSIDHRSTDVTGQRSHERARLSTLKMNQLTGDFSGQGPGWVRSVHLASGDFGGLGGQQANNAQPALNGAANPGAANSGLRFLRINFQRGISGNLNSRALRFHERVRGVYGPVLAWDQELPINSPQGLPPEVVALECDELRVHEDPSVRYVTPRNGVASSERPFGPIELRALGGVRIEGSSGKDKLTKFTTEAVSASYTQTKEVFILEGNSQRGVSIWVQQDPTRPPARSVAGKITYDIRKGQVTKVEDIRSVDYQATPATPSMTR